MKLIQPVVEGHGEMESVPVLLRRLRDEAGIVDLDIARPIRRKQSELTGREGIQKAVRLALCQPDCTAILFLFDSEDACPKELGPQAFRWACEAAAGRPCAVVLAYREYETWFLAAIESLRGKCGIRQDAKMLPSPESRRGAKEALERYMPTNRSYAETVDQVKLSAALDLGLAYRRSRSFRKLVTAFGSLTREVGFQSLAWPPAAWVREP